MRSASRCSIPSNLLDLCPLRWNTCGMDIRVGVSASSELIIALQLISTLVTCLFFFNRYIFPLSFIVNLAGKRPNCSTKLGKAKSHTAYSMNSWPVDVSMHI